MTMTDTMDLSVPRGSRTAVTNTFRLTVPEKSQLDLTQTEGRAELVYYLENTKFHHVRGCLEFRLSGGEQPAWLTIVGQRRRDFSSRETHAFHVLIAIPPDSKKQEFDLRVDGKNEANPDEDFTSKEQKILWEPLPAIKRMRKWTLALIILVPLMLLSLGGKLLYDYLNPATPVNTLLRANTSLSIGNVNWNDYWNYWTRQGQHKLVYRVAFELRTEAAKNPRWRSEVDTLLNSFGLTQKDLSSFEQPAEQIRAYHASEQTRALRRKLERNGHGSQAFFAASASWLQPDKQDIAEDLKLESDDPKVIPELTRQLSELLASFQYWPICEEPLRESSSQRMAIFTAFRSTQPDKVELSRTAMREAVFSRVELEKFVDTAGNQDAAFSAAASALQTFGEQGLRIAFQRDNERWLIDDAYTDNSVEAWFFTSDSKDRITIKDNTSVTAYQGNETIEYEAFESPGGTVEKGITLSLTTSRELIPVDAEIPPIDGYYWAANKTEASEKTLLSHDDGRFLELTNTPIDGVSEWYAKRNAQPSTQFLLTRTVGETKDLLSKCNIESRLINTLPKIAVKEINNSKIRAIYLEIPHSTATDSKKLRVRKLDATDHLPQESVAYLEYEPRLSEVNIVKMLRELLPAGDWSPEIEGGSGSGSLAIISGDSEMTIICEVVVAARSDFTTADAENIMLPIARFPKSHDSESERWLGVIGPGSKPADEISKKFTAWISESAFNGAEIIRKAGFEPIDEATRSQLSLP